MKAKGYRRDLFSEPLTHFTLCRSRQGHRVVKTEFRGMDVVSTGRTIALTTVACGHVTPMTNFPRLRLVRQQKTLCVYVVRGKQKYRWETLDVDAHYGATSSQKTLCVYVVRGKQKYRWETVDVDAHYEATSSQKRWNMARIVRDLTVSPATHTFVGERYKPCLGFPAEAGLHFNDSRGMEGWVDLVVWLHT